MMLTINAIIDSIPKKGTLRYGKKVNLLYLKEPETRENMIRIITLLALIFSLVSCDKDNGTGSGEVLTITPELLVSYYGKNWNTIEGGLKNKKDYLYTNLNNQTTLGVISLPAKDPDAPVKNYQLLINTNQQNIITKVVLTSTEPVDQPTGNKQMLYYYDKVFSKMTGVTYRWASENNPQAPPLTVSDLLLKLNNLSCTEASLSFGNSQMRMSAGYSAATHSFSFDL